MAATGPPGDSSVESSVGGLPNDPPAVAAAQRSGEAVAGADRAQSTSRAMVGGRNLPVAIGVGVVLIAAAAGALWWHPWALLAFVGVLTTVAYIEIQRVLQSVEASIDVPVVVIATWIMLVGASQIRQTGQLVGIVVLIVGALLWHLADPVRRNVVAAASTTVLFGLWVGFLASYVALLVTRPDRGAAVVIAIVGATALADTGGYLTGVTVGRRPIAPTVSPNKTWEGFVGGLAFAAFGGAFALPLLGDTFTAMTGMMVAVACGLAAFVGDLVESMIKRDLGVKDLGRVLPGHGGILDRVDGMLFALPVGYYLVEVLGV